MQNSLRGYIPCLLHNYPGMTIPFFDQLYKNIKPYCSQDHSSPKADVNLTNDDAGQHWSDSDIGPEDMTVMIVMRIRAICLSQMLHYSRQV
jgi:hypothetical protein